MYISVERYFLMGIKSGMIRAVVSGVSGSLGSSDDKRLWGGKTFPGDARS